MDGVQVAVDASVTAGEVNTGYWRFGYDNLGGWASAPTSYYFNGTLDEPFVTHTEVSADFIKLAYATRVKNSVAVTYPNTALSTFAYSNKVYVNTTASGANTTADVTNFPLLVRLTSANFNFAQARTDGGDLRFADSTGALLPYELERFDATNKLAEAWVLLPTVKANNNSQWFRMYWGKASATSLSSPASVFQASNGFAGVWHMDGTLTDASPDGKTAPTSAPPPPPA